MTFEEMEKACRIAATIVEGRKEQYKPDRPKGLDPGGVIQELVFCGSDGDDLVVAVYVTWTYLTAGAIGRAGRYLHVRLRLVTKDGGRFLRPVSLHEPQWTNGNARPCLICGPAFNERHVIQADTSLHEF